VAHSHCHSSLEVKARGSEVQSESPIRIEASIIVSHSLSLSPKVRPSITNSGGHRPEITVIRGKSISLECEVQGIPQPTVTWMKDGRPLTKGKGVEILDEGRILQLKNVHVSDTGRYVCVAVNVAGMTDKRYDLSVHGE
jgi:hemicentin